MLPSDAKLIHQFFAVFKNLSDSKIIRSKNMLGDIGEWICEHKYDLVREVSGRHPGYDGKIGNSRVQVKVHNSPEGNNLNVGDPTKYDEVIVLLGRSSNLRVRPENDTFHVYRFPSSDVELQMKRKKGYFLARTVLENIAPEFVNIET